MHVKLLCIQSAVAAKRSTMIQPRIIPSHCLSILYKLHRLSHVTPARFHLSRVKLHEKNNFGPPFKCFLGEKKGLFDENRSWFHEVDTRTVKTFPFNGALDGFQSGSVYLNICVSSMREIIFTIHLSTVSGFILSSLLWQRNCATSETPCPLKSQRKSEPIIWVSSW